VTFQQAGQTKRTGMINPPDGYTPVIVLPPAAAYKRGKSNAAAAA
jgi:hypothetical protein